MKRLLFLLLILFISNQNILAQCYCEDCPEPIIFGSPSSATLNVSGITNNTLGQNGQSLINVGVSFTHDAAQELSLRLVAPDGSFVDLTIGEGLNFGDNNNFDINFVQCTASPLPDCTNGSTWTSTDEWNGGPYTGSYFPESGCLEDLTGNVNGTWTLEMEDVFVIEDGELFCFDISFADAAGAMCNMSGCDDEVCLAQGGQQLTPLTLIAPEGDPSLIIDYDVIYAECEIPSPSPEYVFVFVIYEPFPGPIIDIVEGTVDMTSYSEGTYLVHGLSILASDLPTIQALDYATTTFSDIFNMIQNGEICADNTTIHAVVEINNCTIDFTGIVEFDVIEAEAGDPALNPDWTLTWNPAEPDFSIFGLYYVVYEQSTGIIIDYLTEDDFTGLPAGDYNVAVLVYDLDEEPNLPPIDGASVYIDIVNAIITDDLCAIIFGNNQLFISEPCTIDIGGILEQEDITAPQNDPALDPDWEITFTGDDPDPAIYGFYFVVVNADTDLLIAYYTTDDFTLLLEGNYYVTVVYYLLDDQQTLPPPNGTNTFTDLVDLINNDELCAQYFGYNLLNITAQCEADAGSFSDTEIEECLGDVDLILDLTPEYPISGPDETEYGYTYVVSQNGIVIAIDPSQDFTGYDLGEYEICGLSYLLTDEPNLPFPNGSITTNTILNDIDNNLYCADLTEICVTLIITEPPMPIFTGPLEVCAGEEVEYVVGNFTGDNQDYLFTINQGGFTQFINNEDGTLSVIWASGPGNICVTEISEGCETQECITIDVLPQPIVSISGPEIVCPGDELEYTISPTPQGGEFYDIVVSGGSISSQTGNTVTILWDDTVEGIITATLLGGACDSEPYIFGVIKEGEVDFPVVTIPEVSCINSGLAVPDIDNPDILDWEWTATNADISIQAGFVNFTWQSVGLVEICLEITTACGGEQMCYEVDVLEAPEPFIAEVLEFCSLTFMLDATPSIGNSWLWTSPNSGNTVSYSDQTNFMTEVTVTAPGTYTFILQEFSSNCSGLVETTVIVTDGLSTDDPVIICDDEGNYIVNFSITSGTAPYMVDGTTISGNTFSSSNIVSGEMYTFFVEDSEGCTTIVEGSFVCPCISDAGSMSSMPISLCASNDESGQGIHNADATFDFDDLGQFVLHTGSGAMLGNVISINNDGVFFFDPLSMVEGQVYYISYVVGNELLGGVDLSDPCLSVANGQSIIFYGDPEVDAGEDTSSCDFNYNLSANAITTNGLWSIVSQPDGSTAELQIILGQTYVEVNQEGVYTFNLEVEENGCIGNGQVSITFSGNPEITDLTTICNGDTYIVEFEIIGGVSPYFVNGDMINSNLFTSNPFASGDVYSFTILDSEGCSSEFIQGTEVCNCTTDAGTMSEEEVTICAVEGTLMTGLHNDDAVFDSNDGGIYILHTGSSNILGDILSISSVPEFAYSNNFGTDITIYISYVVGNEVGGSIELTDECLSVAVGQPINISSLLQVDAGNYNDQCGYSFDLNANDQGSAGEWIVLDSPTSSNIEFGNRLDAQSTFETDLAGQYSLAWQPTALCIIPDTTIFELFPVFTIIDEVVTCSDDLGTYTVTIEVTGGEAPYYLDGNETSSNFDLPSIDSGNSYSFVLTDSRGCELTIEGTVTCECTNIEGSMSLDTLRGCIQDTLIGIYNNDAVLDSNDVALFVLHTSAADTLGAVFAISEEPIVTFLPGMIEGTVYYLSHIIANGAGTGIEFTDPCLKISEGQPILFNSPPDVNAGIDRALCTLTTDLEGSASTFSTTWKVIQTPLGATYDLNESDPESELTVSVIGEYVLALEADNGYCTNTDTVVITFIEPLSYQDLVVDCSAAGYTVSFTILGGLAPYSIDGNLISGNTFESGEIGLGESYTFTISDGSDCLPIVVEGVDTCECENDAGTMSSDLIELCIDEIIDLNELNNNDAVLDENDNRYHVIHTSSNSQLGDVLGFQMYLGGVQELIFEDFSFEVGVIYYISTVVANEGVLDGGAIDPCMKVAPGTPIIWYDFNEVTFNQDVESCIGDTMLLDVTAAGQFPFEIVVTDNLGYNEVIIIDQENNVLVYIVSGEAILNISSPVEEKCLDVGKSDLMISIVEIPEAEVRESSTICNNEVYGSLVELDELLISGADYGTWNFDGNVVNGSIDFDGVAEGEYELVYVVESELCSISNSYSVQIIVEDCDCPTFGYEVQDISCYGEEDGVIMINTSGNVDMSAYTILLNNQLVEEDLEIRDLTAGTYILDITNGENCIALFEIEINEPEPVRIDLGADIEAEINDPVVIEAITNLINEEIDQITWASLAGILDDTGLLLNTSFENDDMISINIVDENGCEGSDDIMVRVTFTNFSIPNVISTNSTSGNETFKIYNTEGIDAIIKMAIYDRWGNQVFLVGNLSPDSELAAWDGTFDNTSVNPGVYIYQFVLLIDGKEETFFGDLTVLK